MCAHMCAHVYSSIHYITAVEWTPHAQLTLAPLLAVVEPSSLYPRVQEHHQLVLSRVFRAFTFYSCRVGSTCLSTYVKWGCTVLGTQVLLIFSTSAVCHHSFTEVCSSSTVLLHIVNSQHPGLCGSIRSGVSATVSALCECSSAITWVPLESRVVLHACDAHTEAGASRAPCQCGFRSSCLQWGGSL